MSCDVEQILGYIDGRLQEEKQAEMERHLATCNSCRLRVGQFRAVMGLLDESPRIEPSSAFDLRVRSLLAGEPVNRRQRRFLSLSLRSVFAACLLLVATLWVGFYESRRAPALPWSDPQTADEEMMRDLPVLEDHDLLSNFEPLKELTAAGSDMTSGSDHPMDREDDGE